MNRAMYAAASGMAAEQTALDTVTENLSNADVTAFKEHISSIRSFGSGDNALGVSVDGNRMSNTPGKLAVSGGPFDVAIRGDGFFAVQRGHEISYTRDGAFSRNVDGLLCNRDGWHLAGIRVPADVQALTVAADGRVHAKRAHSDGVIGRIRVALFHAPDQLHEINPTLFSATKLSGEAVFVAPNVERGPSVAFGMLERSNVSIVDSMMEIMKSQRAYEADAKGVQAADDMTRIANNLERGS